MRNLISGIIGWPDLSANGNDWQGLAVFDKESPRGGAVCNEKEAEIPAKTAQNAWYGGPLINKSLTPALCLLVQGLFSPSY